MFTGIVEEVGRVSNVSKKNLALTITIKCSKVLEDTVIGDSIAVNGVCLTVINLGSGFFEADISYETLDKSSLKHIKSGIIVNLERALTFSSRLGGHIVQGHVDAVGRITGISKYGESYRVSINYPQELDKYIVSKCSIAIDGISLTVAKVKNNSFETAVIPHTYEKTTLSKLSTGSLVNLETDILARYVEKMFHTSSKDDRLKNMVAGLIYV